jgi:hypothetical protein
VPTPEDIPDQEVQPAPEEGQDGEDPELEGGQVGDEDPAGDDDAEDGDDDEDDDDDVVSLFIGSHYRTLTATYI